MLLKKMRGSIVLEVVALVVSAIALVFAVMTYLREPGRDSDKVTVDLIRQVYSDFISITEQRAAHPLQSHLFEVPDNYEASAAQVRLAVGAVRGNKAEVSRLLLEERAVADRIFTMFEQAFYQWSNAKENGDSRREKFLQDVLNYYTERLLRNPRLVWYWSAAGGKLLVHYETATQEFYSKNVKPSSLKADAVGAY
ncbi:hypothetical protein ACQ859_27880 [Roseateles chitinivorans]|uniref:hypothetical protein n=1 Tax=Roseateles chitinivorans TaxID=2917965 RepID=UPI003D66B41E